MAWEESMDVGKGSVREKEEEGGGRWEEEEEKEENEEWRRRGRGGGEGKGELWRTDYIHTHTHRMSQTTKYNGELRNRSQVTVQPSSTHLEPLALPRYDRLMQAQRRYIEHKEIEP